MTSTRVYHAYQHIKTGTRYLWVDLATSSTGYVMVCTDAQSVYFVKFKNLGRIS